MTGKLAAKVTSMTHHQDAKAMPGPGSPNVQIGGNPAWRAEIDMHDCPDDGPEKVLHGGSDKVLINGYRAARMDDILESDFGPPNIISWGNNDRVEIGATEVGITTPDAIAEFCKDMCALEKDWAGLTPEQRQERYKDAVGKQYDRMGAPRPNFEFFDSAKNPDIGAYWNAGSWTIGLPSSTFSKPTYPKDTMTSATYHEIRHSQQTYYSLRSAAGRIKRGDIDKNDPGEPQNAEDLSQLTGVNAEVARRAMATPLDPNTPEGRYGASQESAAIKMAGIQKLNDVSGRIWDASTRLAEAQKKGDTAAAQKAQTDLMQAADDYRHLPGGSDAKHAEGELWSNCTCPP